jgi:23S rRNA (adenine2503-C2)-methyltransferase
MAEPANDQGSIIDLAVAGGPQQDGRPSLLGCHRSDLEALAASLGERPFRGRQLFASIFARKVDSFAAMTDLTRELRATLAARFSIARPTVDRVLVSEDGTRKYRFLAADGAAFEAVYIPEVARDRKTNTLCVSSQTGCSVGCAFCFTASLKRWRNLAAGEIVGQVLAVQADVAALGEAARVSNIVFMGMGEPLLNYDNTARAARLLTDPDGMDFSSRRVTISTSGIVPRIADLGRDLDTQIAISLNATTDETRSRIMPINRKWGLDALMAALRAYPLPRRRRLSVEYVLLDGINDSDEDARRLVKLLAGIPVKINLLPLNPHDRTALSPPSEERVRSFQSILRRAGLNAIVRNPRGREIGAACGQLGPQPAS